MLYEKSGEFFRERILARYPDAISEFFNIDTIEFDENGKCDEEKICRYLLWMFDNVHVMDKGSVESRIKAASWVGWAFGVLWKSNKFILNSENRDLVREDKKLGNY